MASDSITTFAASVAQGAQAFGHSVEQSHYISAIAVQEARKLRDAGKPVTRDSLAEAIKTFALEESARYEAIREAENGMVKALEEDGALVDDYKEEEKEQRGEMTMTRNGEVYEVVKTPTDSVTSRVVEVDGMRMKRLVFKDNIINKYFGGKDPYDQSHTSNSFNEKSKITLNPDNKDFISRMLSNVELATELGKHLRPLDIVNLFSVCKSFNNTVKGYLMSTIRAWIKNRCPEAGSMYPFKYYRLLLVPDPAQRTWGEQYEGQDIEISDELRAEVRTVPGLRYLQLVLGRDRCCREIIAIMARNGHRMPPTMYGSLLRMWLLMDLSTTGNRMIMLRSSTLWTDYDLYNCQLFIIKLSLLFNDPIYGPCSNDLIHLMLGQKGLYPLWQLLFRKRFTTLTEILELKCRYNTQIPQDQVDLFIESKGAYRYHNVPFPEIGIFHLQGWGKHPERIHLSRPDELIPMEAVRRGLALDMHIRAMMHWGHFDYKTGENIVPSEEEIYISDEEDQLSHMDTKKHWRKKHALKKRWHTLTKEQQQDIIDEEEDDRLRAMAYCIEDDEQGLQYTCQPESDEYDPNLEITRGWIIPRQKHNKVPQRGDKKGWVDFANRALIGHAPKLDQNEAWDLLPHMYDYPDDVDDEDDEDDEDPKFGPDFDMQKYLEENWNEVQLLRAMIADRTQQTEGSNVDGGSNGVGARDGAVEGQEDVDDATLLGGRSDSENEEDTEMANA